MEDNENVVLEDTENVGEQATEELVDGNKAATKEEKLYSQAELDKLVNEKVDELLPKKLERAKSKLEREYAESNAKHRRLEEILKAGTGKESVDELSETFKNFYTENGVQIPEFKEYRSEKEERILADAEANDIISSGYDDIVEEVDRLSKKGVEKMTPREKLVFQRLATERQRQDSINELAKIGVKSDVLEDADYQEFSKNLNPNLSEKQKYEMYLKFKPTEQKNVKPLGSQRTVTSQDDGLKEFYTPEEASRFTRKDFDNNPELFKRVCDSMTKWGK